MHGNTWICYKLHMDTIDQMLLETGAVAVATGEVQGVEITDVMVYSTIG